MFQQALTSRIKMDKGNQDEKRTSRIIHLANVSERYRRSLNIESDPASVNDSLSIPIVATSNSAMCNSQSDSLMTSPKKKSCLKTHQLPMFLSSKFDSLGFLLFLLS